MDAAWLSLFARRHRNLVSIEVKYYSFFCRVTTKLFASSRRGGDCYNEHRDGVCFEIISVA